MRHPKPCRFFERNSCKFDNCAYSHRKDGRDVKIENLENQVTDLKSEVKALSKTSNESQIEVKNLLQQVAEFSNNLKGVIKQIKRDRKQQENYKEKSEAIEKTNYNEIREDIKLLKATNEKNEKIKLMEEESLYESDEDSDSTVETEFINSVVSKPKIEVKNKNPDEKHKCGQCDFVGKTKVERNKNSDTKHQVKSVQAHDDKISGVEGIDDMFQIGFLKGEHV